MWGGGGRGTYSEYGRIDKDSQTEILFAVSVVDPIRDFSDYDPEQNSSNVFVSFCESV